MRHGSIVFATLAVLLCSSASGATTWVVDPGGGGDATTIGGGLALASSGDTVLVEPGVYTENIDMVSGVTLKGRLGWTLTTIEPGSSSQPVISCVSLADPVTIAGFTVRGGRARVGAGVYCFNCRAAIIDNRFTNNRAGDDGGAIAYVECESGRISGSRFDDNSASDRGGGLLCERSSPVVEGNGFYDNVAHYGAAICCAYSASPDILANTFRRNLSSKWGGGITCMSESSPLIEANTFEYGEAAGSGGGVCCWDGCSPTILGNSFTSNLAWYGGAITASDSCASRIENNIFTGCQGEYGGAVCIYAGSHAEVIGNEFTDQVSTKWGGAILIWSGASGLIEQNLFHGNTAAASGGAICHFDYAETGISGNVFWANEAVNGGGIEVSAGCVSTCHGNTFYANVGSVTGSAVDAYGGGHVDVRNCIFASSAGGAAINCWGGGTATSDCNDFWVNASDLNGCAPGPKDFFLDPMLCDPVNGDFHIDCQSPCRGRPGCGLVGALDVGCGSTRTESRTWGAIKAMYR